MLRLHRAVAFGGFVASCGAATLQLWSCDNASSLQAWLLETAIPEPHAHITLRGSLNASTNLWLLMTVGGSASTGSGVDLQYNTSGPGSEAQQWVYFPNGTIMSRSTGLCLTSSLPVAGSAFSVQPCSANYSQGQGWQSFVFDPVSGHLTSDAPSQGARLCLDAGSTASCATAPLNATVYCDPDAPTAARVADLVPRILPAEYPQLLANTGFGVPVRCGGGTRRALHRLISSPCAAPWRPWRRLRRVPPRHARGLRRGLHERDDGLHVDGLPHVLPAPPPPRLDAQPEPVGRDRGGDRRRGPRPAQPRRARREHLLDAQREPRARVSGVTPSPLSAAPAMPRPTSLLLPPRAARAGAATRRRRLRTRRSRASSWRGSLAACRATA